MNERGELDAVADKEDWCGVHHHIKIAFLGIELDGKASWIPESVGRTFLTAYGAEPNGYGSSFADLREEVGVGLT